MLPFLADDYGNPSGSHSVARAAQRALDDARDELAGLLGARARARSSSRAGAPRPTTSPSRVSAAGPGTVLCSAVEHPAVLEACRAAGGRAIGVDERGVSRSRRARRGARGRGAPRLGDARQQRDGRAPAALRDHRPRARARPLGPRAHRRRAGLRLGRPRRAGLRRGGPVEPERPQVRRPERRGRPRRARASGGALRPLFHGGPQERERRAGTQNVAGIVAMAAAARATADERDVACRRVRALAGAARRRDARGGVLACS